jgi:ferredoxin
VEDVPETIIAHVLASGVIGVDETRWRMLDGRGRDAGEATNWQAWAMSCPDAIAYRIQDSRSTEAARQLIGDFDGIVMVDRHICIGCRYCMMACPYKARSFVHEPQSGQEAQTPRGKGCVEACNLCAPRIDRGGIPACVEACAKIGRRAIVFGDLNDPSSEISRRIREVSSRALRAELGLDPGVRYAGL